LHKAVSEKLLQAGGIGTSAVERDNVAMDNMRVTDEMAVFGTHP
jgi:hypothetical protein